MKKSLYMAALAGVLAVCGLTASAQEDQKQAPKHNQNAILSEESRTMSVKNALRIMFIAEPDYNLTEKLTTVLNSDAGKSMGYLVNPGTDNENFVSLSEAIPSLAVTSTKAGASIAQLGQFKSGDNVQFGYKNGDEPFVAAPISVLSSDSGYYAGYNSDSFYELDFSKMPFDGQIDILVVGEPLPSSSVTLIVSLAALAIFVGFVRRKQQQAHAVQES